MKSALSILLLLFISKPSYSLDVNGNGPTRSKVKALYLFNSMAGNKIQDEVGDADLDIIYPGRFEIVDENYKGISHKALNVKLLGGGLRTTTPPTSLISQCSTSQELTIEAWITSRQDNDLVESWGPTRIVSLSNGAGKENAFYFGQGYDGGSFYNFNFNTRDVQDCENASGNACANYANDNDYDLRTVNQNGDDNGDDVDFAGSFFRTNPEDREIVRNDKIQQVIFTVDKDKMARLYISDEYGIPVLRGQPKELSNADLTRWDSNFRLGVFNDALFDAAENGVNGDNPILQVQDANGRHLNDRGWRGKLHMLAIYCDTLQVAEILDGKEPTDWLVSDIPLYLDPNLVVTPEMQFAHTLYRRITGVSRPIYHQTIADMAAELQGNIDDEEARMRAAAIATNDAPFYNITVRDFAKRMSNREETVAVPLNDFAAMVIGATNDNRDARELLTGDFTYVADRNLASVPSNLLQDITLSNRHYESLEVQNYDLQKVLRRVDQSNPYSLSGKTVRGQLFYDGKGNFRHAKDYSGDAAGLLTSRAFMSAHAIAGTNRRMIHFSFKQFLCRDISEWANNSGDDALVGRDVDRFPGGGVVGHEKYLVTCKGCHSQMDPMRGAFARFTFETGFVKHAIVMDDDPRDGNETDVERANRANNNTNMRTMVQVPRGIAGKFAVNSDTFEEGNAVTTDYWNNYSTDGKNGEYFGWDPTKLAGRGPKEYGEMLANSRVFSECMTRRAYRSVCKRETVSSPEEKAMILKVAESFRSPSQDNYKLRRLFERIAVQPECLGD